MKGDRRVLIAGCGYVGTALAKTLASDGIAAFGMRRDPSTLPSSIVGIAADMTEASSLTVIPEDITDVVITASPGGGDDDRYVAAYVRGPQTLLDHLARRGDPIQRVILTTSTGVYAQTDGSWVDEASETEPTHHSGKRMLEGESLILSQSFAGTAVRLAGIYGPGRTRLIDRVRTGVARTPRQVRWTNRIHRDDCAGVLRHLLRTDDPPPSVVVGVDREPAGLGEVQRLIAQELGVDDPALEDEVDPAASGRRARSNKRCASALITSLGYAFSYPSYREGYRAMLADPALRG